MVERSKSGTAFGMLKDENLKKNENTGFCSSVSRANSHFDQLDDSDEEESLLEKL